MNLMAVLLVLISPAVGSFLGVLADRLVRGEDVVAARSACRDCKRVLGWRELVPVLSYLAQRGRCAGCGAAIPVVLPLVEGGAVICAVAVVFWAQSDVQMVLGAVYLWLLLALLATDAQHFRLPDVLTGLVFLVGMALAWEDPARGLLDGVIGAALASAAFWAIRRGYFLVRRREGLGLGDVKLMAGIGAGVGAMQVPLVVLIAAVGALVWAGVRAGVTGQSLNGQVAAPFGAFLCLGAGVVWLGML